VLEHPLHHGPTRGGRAEDAKYNNWYAKTLESYARVFGSDPPADIWPEPAQRFSRNIRWCRVNTAAHWLVPRSKVRRLAATAAGGLIAGGVLAACSGDSGSVNIGGWLMVGLLGFAGIYSFMANRKPQSGQRKNSDGSSSTDAGAGTGCSGGCSSGPAHHDDHGNNSPSDSDGGGGSHSGGDSGGSDSGCSSSGCGGGCGGGD
jgi:hypothetical protein